jgi:hypothetical protein
MKKFLLVLLMSISCVVGAQQIKTPVTFGDDTWVNVPLQFPFPLYGRVFTNSFMFSNGVVSFMNVGAQPTNSYCCEGVQVNNQTPISFHYTIMPMQTDLYPGPQSRFYTQGDATYQKYWWENISEYSSGNNLNTFQVEIKPTGYIGIKYDQVNIQNQLVTSAVIGDASRGEYSLHYYGRGMTASSVPSLIEYGSTGSICTSNPLADPACPGYAEAYFNQQCSANPLYAATCPGYQQAYYTQQCSINPLYDSGCPGYAGAYFSQQCTANPLYDSLCPGYQQAYFNQQCTANPLYDTGCPGYQQAYFNEQCTINPLYNTGCSGYAVAYFNQQCQTNGLYSQQCPNYATAYAKQQVLQQQNVLTTPTSTTIVSPLPTTNTVNNTGTVQLVADTNVNNAITPPATTSATSVSPASPVSVVNKQPVSQNTVQQAAQPPAPTPTQAAAQQEQKQEQGKTEQKVANTVEKKMDSGAKGDQQKMKDAVAKVQKEIAKEAQEAKTIEAQVATQGLVVGSMNFVPGFDAYKNALIPDTNALLMTRQYQKPVVDNQRVQRRLSGANELRWQQMVDSQYQIGK